MISFSLFWAGSILYLQNWTLTSSSGPGSSTISKTRRFWRFLEDESGYQIVQHCWRILACLGSPNMPQSCSISHLMQRFSVAGASYPSECKAWKGWASRFVPPERHQVGRGKEIYRSEFLHSCNLVAGDSSCEVRRLQDVGWKISLGTGKVRTDSHKRRTCQTGLIWHLKFFDLDLCVLSHSKFHCLFVHWKMT